MEIRWSNAMTEAKQSSYRQVGSPALKMGRRYHWTLHRRVKATNFVVDHTKCVRILPSSAWNLAVDHDKLPQLVRGWTVSCIVISDFVLKWRQFFSWNKYGTWRKTKEGCVSSYFNPEQKKLHLIRFDVYLCKWFTNEPLSLFIIPTDIKHLLLF